MANAQMLPVGEQTQIHPMAGPPAALPQGLFGWQFSGFQVKNCAKKCAVAKWDDLP